MKKEIIDLPKKLKKMGLSVVEQTKKGISKVKSDIKNTFLEDNLRKRFNLENPYKFQMIKEGKEIPIIDELFYKNAKRYEDDDIFVFYGSIQGNGFVIGQKLRDLSDNAVYEIKNITEVNISVEYNNELHEVIGTACECELI